MTPRPLTDAERAELRELLAKCNALESVYGAAGYDLNRLDRALRNHAEALLDAADELARLKAGVADRDHTTHFDDCGCRSARYEAECARLKAKLAAVEPVARAAVKWWYGGDLRHVRKSVAALTADLRDELAATTFRDDTATTPEGHEDERQGEVPGA